MKLLIIGAYPVHNSGISDYIAHYLRELTGRGHQVETEKVYFWQEKSRNFRWLTLASRLNEGFDAVIVQHTATASGPLLPFFLRAAARKKIPVAVVGHEPPSVYERHLPGLLRRWYRSYEKSVYRHAAVRVVHTRAHAAELRELGLEGEIQVIPHPVFGAAPSTTPTQRARSCWAYFGMVSHKKGLDLLLSAYQAHPAGSLPVLRILGTAAPGHEDYLEDLKTGLGPSHRPFVEFKGYIAETALTAELDAVSMMIFPYRWVSQSGALAHGCMNRIPYLAADLPYFADFQREYGCGRLFRAGSSEDLARALGEARDNPMPTDGPEFDKMISELGLSRCTQRLLDCIEDARHTA